MPVLGRHSFSCNVRQSRCVGASFTKPKHLIRLKTSCCGSRETRRVARLFFCGLQLFDTVLPERLKFERRWSLVFVTRLGRRLLAQMRERWLRTRCRCHAQRRDQGERYQAPPRESTYGTPRPRKCIVSLGTEKLKGQMTSRDGSAVRSDSFCTQHTHRAAASGMGHKAEMDDNAQKQSACIVMRSIPVLTAR